MFLLLNFWFFNNPNFLVISTPHGNMRIIVGKEKIVVQSKFKNAESHSQMVKLTCQKVEKLYRQHCKYLESMEIYVHQYDLHERENVSILEMNSRREFLIDWGNNFKTWSKISEIGPTTYTSIVSALRFFLSALDAWLNKWSVKQKI